MKLVKGGLFILSQNLLPFIKNSFAKLRFFFQITSFFIKNITFSYHFLKKSQIFLSFPFEIPCFPIIFHQERSKIDSTCMVENKEIFGKSLTRHTP